MNNITQPIKIVYSQVPLDKTLKDARVYTRFAKFGTVKSICQQYGVKYKELENCIEFSAPQLRLQMLIEKLHFSRTPYSNFPY